MAITRTQHYQFTFNVLPKFIFENTDASYRLFSGNDIQDVLKRIWWSLGERTGEYLPDTGLSVEKFTLSDSGDIFIIELPPPLETQEAVFIGVYFDLVSNQQNPYRNARIITLELGIDCSTGYQAYFLGEVTKNQNDKYFDHNNFGHINNNDKISFMMEIIKIVTKTKVSKPNEVSPTIPKGDSSSSLVNISAQEQIERIWNLYEDVEIDDQIYIDSEAFCNLMEVTKKLFSKLDKRILASKNLLMLEDEVNRQLMYLFKIPLFFGIISAGKRVDEAYFSEQKKILMESSPVNDLKKLYTLLIIELSSQNKMAEEEIENSGRNLGEMILTTLISGFFLGTQSIVTDSRILKLRE